MRKKLSFHFDLYDHSDGYLISYKDYNKIIPCQNIDQEFINNLHLAMGNLLQEQYDLYIKQGRIICVTNLFSDKPPLGIIPRKIHNELRLEELKKAIQRYIEAGLKVKEEWIHEYNELLNSSSTI